MRRNVEIAKESAIAVAKTPDAALIQANFFQEKLTPLFYDYIS
jgi:hypothetical protein